MTARQAMTNGFSAALFVGVAVALVGTLLAWTLLRPRPAAAVTSIERHGVATDDHVKAA